MVIILKLMISFLEIIYVKHKFKSLILQNRKGQTIDTSNKSINANALKKFSVDIHELARNGKLDPVIEEKKNRRSIQVLSRRIQEQPCLNRRARCWQDGHC